MYRDRTQPNRFAVKAAYCLACLLTLTLCANATEEYYSGGTGEPNDPFLISTPEDLNDIGNHEEHWDKHFVLTNDVNVAAYRDTQFKIIGDLTAKFTGTFDGNDHKVWNLTWSSAESVKYIGLFGYAGAGGQIRDLGLELVDINTPDGKYVAGLVGRSSSCIITNCYVTGSVSADNKAGGLVGGNFEGVISSCYSTVNVTGNTRLGSLAGDNSHGEITHCYGAGDVNAIGDYAGGLVGDCSIASVANCYATGDVRGSDYLGGLIGFIGNSWDSSPRCTVANCYATGSVTGTGSRLGGLLGGIRYCDVKYSYFLAPGEGGGPDNGWGIPLTNTQMRQWRNFIGFDFWGEVSDGTHEIWSMPPAGDYPLLSVFEGFSPHPLQGSGTCGDPYLITDIWDIGVVHYNPDACYVLSNDVNLVGTTWFVAPVPEFRGCFDGNSHVISGLTIMGYDYLGLFGKIADPCASITDLGVEDVNIVGKTYVGGLAGDNAGGIISHCYATGCVAGVEYSSCLGTLVGRNYGGTILDCNVVGSVTGADDSSCLGVLVGQNEGGVVTNCDANGYVIGGEDTIELGGLVGYSVYGDIVDCYATAFITGRSRLGVLVGRCYGSRVSDCHATGNVAGRFSLGGLIGKNNAGSGDNPGGTVDNCYAIVSVSGTADAGSLGGLVGSNDGVVANCYAKGSVAADRDSGSIGGLAGSNEGEISKCYSTGSVNGDRDSVYIGGLVGYNNGTVMNCYARGSVTAGNSSSDVGGLVGWDAGVVRLSYASASVMTGSYSEYVGGLVGRGSSPIIHSYFLDPNDGGGPVNEYGTVLNDIQMRNRANFIGFDFLGETAFGTHEVWAMPEAGGYPILSFLAGIFPYELAGSGTPGDPYLITDANDLGTVMYRPDACYQLVNDINFAEIIWSITPIPEFTGVFDGQSHEIANLSLVEDGYAGLFGRITDPCALIANLRLEAVDITGYPAGGLAGRNYGIIRNCYITGNVTGSSYLGGLVGVNYSGGIISQCSASGYVTGVGNMVGGLVGKNYSIIDCSYVAENVTGEDYVGGFVGQNREGTISNCYANGSVSGEDRYVGGFVGFNGCTAGCDASIANSYAACLVDADDEWAIAGFCSGRNADEITDCYYLNLSYPFERPAEPRSESGMRTEETFDDWDFIGENINGPNDIWTIDEGEDYPRLVWEIVRGFAPDGVDFQDYCLLADYWGDADCESSGDCGGVDVDFSGGIDFTDLRALAQYWLSGL